MLFKPLARAHCLVFLTPIGLPLGLVVLAYEALYQALRALPLDYIGLNQLLKNLRRYFPL